MHEKHMLLSWFDTCALVEYDANLDMMRGGLQWAETFGNMPLSGWEQWRKSLEDQLKGFNNISANKDAEKGQYYWHGTSESRGLRVIYRLE